MNVQIMIFGNLTAKPALVARSDDDLPRERGADRVVLL